MDKITEIIGNIKNKKWINPCINYNLGFQEVKTDIVIIQNAEVCHCGDIIKYVFDHINQLIYLVFDVCSIPSLEGNHELYKSNGSLVVSMEKNGFLEKGGPWGDSPHLKPFFSQTGIWGDKPQWYQHMTFNRNYHFLSAIT